MKMKPSLLVVALCVAPSFSFAMGCPKAEQNITASSCVAGTVWDSVKESCVAPANT